MRIRSGLVGSVRVALGWVLVSVALAAPSARAQTQVMVERESMQARLQNLGMQISTLLTQVKGQGAVESQLSALRAQIQSLEQDLANAKPAGAPGVAAAPMPPPGAPPPVDPNAMPPPPGAAPPGMPPPGVPTQPGMPPPAEVPPAVGAPLPPSPVSPPVVVVQPPAPPPAPVIVYASPAIDPASFDALISSIAYAPYSGGKQAAIRNATRVHMFTVDQVLRILQYLTFGGDRMYALRHLGRRIVNPQDNYRILDALPYIHEKRRARRYLGM